MTECCLLELPPTPSFTTDDICTHVARHHLHLKLGDTITHGQRQGFTTILITFDNNTHPMYYTNNEGKWVKQFHPLSTLTPAPPPSATKEVIVLNGTHKGRIANVAKFKKSTRVVELKSDNREVWQESLNTVYYLEPQKDNVVTVKHRCLLINNVDYNVGFWKAILLW